MYSYDDVLVVYSFHLFIGIFAPKLHSKKAKPLERFYRELFTEKNEKFCFICSLQSLCYFCFLPIKIIFCLNDLNFLTF